MHDARLYYNTMLPPLSQSSIGNQLKLQTEPFVKNKSRPPLWPNKYEVYKNLKERAANFKIEESDTDLEQVKGSPYIKHRVKFSDEVMDQE